MGKKGDLSDFERGMVVGTRRAGLSISKTVDLLGFSRTTISRVYREGSEQEKISSDRQLCGWKFLVDVRDQRRMDRLVRDDRKATVTQITTRYNQGMQNTTSECTTRQTLKQMGSHPWETQVPRSHGSSSLITARIAAPRSHGSSPHVTARRSIFKSCLALRNSFNLSCRSCPRRLVWGRWLLLLRSRRPFPAACLLVAEVEAIAEGHCEGPWLLIMPRRSLSFQAYPRRASCSCGLSCPVSLALWAVLSCLCSPRGLLIPPSCPMDIYLGGRGVEIRLWWQGRVDRGQGHEDHLPRSPTCLFRSGGPRPVSNPPECPAPSLVELLRRG